MLRQSLGSLGAGTDEMDLIIRKNQYASIKCIEVVRRNCASSQ